MKVYTLSGYASGGILIFCVIPVAHSICRVYIYLASTYSIIIAVYMFVCICVYSTTQILEECDNQGSQKWCKMQHSWLKG